MTPTPPALIADIGGTNARFALSPPGGAEYDERTLPCADYPGLAEAALAYLAMVKPPVAPTIGAFCVACPVLGDAVALTNNPWRFSIAELQATLGLERLDMINDFAANALACPHLPASDLVQVGGGQGREGFPVGVIGPGTGLGVALLVPDGPGRWVAVAGEGGHVTLPAETEREAAVITLVRRQFAHVSAERLGNGAGLSILYATLAELDGRAVAPLDAAGVAARAVAGDDPHAVEALSMFFAFLGTVAGNLALHGTLGGVYIMGGIVPRVLDFFQRSPFRSRFEAKGRSSTYVRDIPAWVVTCPYPAFLGLATLTRR